MIALAEDTKEEFEHLGVRSKDADTGYARMQATNPHSGKREDVILLSPEKFNDMLAAPSHLELHTDINRAMESFTKVQRRVLHNVLIRGMSIEVATARMSKSSRWWRRWLTDEALPALRVKLADYVEFHPDDNSCSGPGKLVIR